jgi:hypothetical protein
MTNDDGRKPEGAPERSPKRQGGREGLAHRLDLLWAKGRLPSSASDLVTSLVMV